MQRRTTWEVVSLQNAAERWGQCRAHARGRLPFRVVGVQGTSGEVARFLWLRFAPTPPKRQKVRCLTVGHVGGEGEFGKRSALGWTAPGAVRHGRAGFEEAGLVDHRFGIGLPLQP